jgi:ABC-type Fe3+-hydroxamate transport system substrate-binding protein
LRQATVPVRGAYQQHGNAICAAISHRLINFIAYENPATAIGYFCCMLRFQDQCGENVVLGETPQRIVSLVPSQTEFLHALGLERNLVGVTRYCVHPEHIRKRAIQIGGTKKLKLDAIRKLNPDLIIGNKEENEKEQIEELRREFPVWMSDIITIEDSFEMMRRLAEITGKRKESDKLIHTVDNAMMTVRGAFAGKKCLYFMWRKPWMAAGKGTFISSMLDHLGFENVAAHLPRYPELSEDAIRELKPDMCLLSSEPYPFSEKNFKELKKLLPESKLLVVEGEPFSWYGKRMTFLEKEVRRIQHLLTSEEQELLQQQK